MPNWTYNTIRCKKYLADRILTKTDNGYCFDFNNLIKMPDDLDIDSSSEGSNGLMYLYALCKDKKDKGIINKAYHNLNPFYDDIYKYNKYKEIKSKINDLEISDDFKKSIELGKKYLSNFKKYGYCNWYKWRIDNWGTKWNVKDNVNVIKKKDEYIIEFDTAWNIPYGIIEEYIKLCKNDSDFLWEYSNEDYDGNHTLTIINGEIQDKVEKHISNDYER